MGRGARPVARVILTGLLAAALAGCGAQGPSFGKRQIVKALKLERDEQGYTLGGDPFCVLTERLFRDAGEVDAATGQEDAGIVIASREGNVAVEGVPSFFGPDCRQRTRKRLDELDPPASGD